VLDFVYPPRCPACGGSVAEQGGLCAACWDDLVIPSDPSCSTCQRPFGENGPTEGASCAICLADPPDHDGIAAGTLYTETARKLVLSFKHGRRIALAPLLARMISARLPPAEGERVIVPVPLHRRRLWERGFNQAEQLCRNLSRATGLKVETRAVKRTRVTQTQTLLSRGERLANMRGAFEPDKVNLNGRRVALVDDVLTTGATTSDCARACKKAGAAEVGVWTLARGLGSPGH